jgi:predicted TIM-barrel fold metal-dependent hydrolase
MMDMENYYDPHVNPVYAWPDEQLRRMSGLMNASAGKLLTFVAFDPKRDDWRMIVDKGIAAGCIGVKFYPPNGYPPFDLATNDFPNRNTRDFFVHCADAGIPVFTHCTLVGFEAMSGYGTRYGNPLLWKRTLERVPKLRLCLGHAGGEPGWFKDVKPGDTNFVAQVIELCANFENVYAEVGFLDDVFDSKLHPAFLHHLETALPRIGKKLMYGSDWHMIHTLKKHAAYLESWKRMLAPASWNTFRDDFFFANAIRWLDLPAHVDRQQIAGNAIEAEARAHWNALVTAAG